MYKIMFFVTILISLLGLTHLFAGPGINVEIEVFIPDWPSEPTVTDDDGNEINASMG